MARNDHSDSYRKLLALAANLRSGIKVDQLGAYKPQPLPTFAAPETSAANDPRALEAAFYASPKYKEYSSGRTNAADTADNGRPKRNILNKVLDALSTGAYASASQSRDIVESFTSARKGDLDLSWLIPGKALVEGVKQGFSNSEKDTYSDVMGDIQRAQGVDPKNHKVANAVGGFIGDVALDPLTYVPVAGAVSLVGKLGKGGKTIANAMTPAVRNTKIKPESAHKIPESFGGTAPKVNDPGQHWVPEKFSSVPPPTPVGAVDEFIEGVGPRIEPVDDIPEPAPKTTEVVAESTAADDVILDAINKSPNTKTPDDFIETPEELFTYQFRNPALKTVKEPDFIKNVVDGTYTDADLKPYMDYLKVDNRDELLMNMKGVYSDVRKNVRAKHWRDTENRIAPDIMDDSGSIASVAMKTSQADLELNAARGNLKNIKKETVGRFSDEGLESAWEKSIKEVVDKNLLLPKKAGKAQATKGTKGPAKDVFYRVPGKTSTVTHLGANNLLDQSTAFNIISKNISKAVRDKYPGTTKRSVFQPEIRKAVIAAHKRYEDIARSKGYSPHLGEGSRGAPISTSDILNILDPKLVDDYLINNYIGGVKMDTVLKGVQIAIHSKSTTRGELINQVSSMMKGVDGMYANGGAKASNATKKTVTIGNKTYENKKFNEANPGQALDDLAEDIVDKMPLLAQVIRYNSNIENVRFGSLIGGISTDKVTEIGKALQSQKFDDAVEQIIDLPKVVEKELKDKGIENPKAIEEAVEAVQEQVDEALGITPEVRIKMDHQAKVADVVADAYENHKRIPRKMKKKLKKEGKYTAPVGTTKSAGKVSEPTESIRKVSEPVELTPWGREYVTAAAAKNDSEAINVAFRTRSAAEKIANSATPVDDAAAMGDDMMEAITKSANGIIDATHRRLNGNYGMGAGAAVFHQGIDTMRGMTVQYVDQLGKMQAKYDKATLKKMFDSFRQGDETGDVDFDGLMNIAFNTGKYSDMARAGITDEKLAYHYMKAGIDKDLFPTASNPSDFKTFDYPEDFDVANYMNKVYMARVEAIKFSSIGNSFSEMFGKTTRPDNNWFRPKFDLDSGGMDKHQLSQYIDTTRYYPKEIIEGFAQMNRHLKEMDELYDYGNASFNQFMNNVVKPISAKWKLWQTVVRPGHHVKNQVGDMFLTQLAGHNNPGIYKDAGRILMKHHKDFKGVDGLMKRMQDDWYGIPNDTVKGGRKYGNHVISDELMHRAAKDQNIMVDFYTAEDLQIGTRGIGGEGMSRLSSRRNPVAQTLGKVEKAGGTVSELRDNHVRLAHFVGAVRKIAKKNPNMSLDEVFGVAGAEVRKWHPNGTGMSNFENKYAKLGMMFYSWNRMVLPLMAESFITRPGRVMVAPKAMYAIAEANGVDLDHGFGNPFPVDQIYPDFLTDDLYGPIRRDADGNEIGITPGIPQLDFLNEMGTPGRFADTVVKSANPIARVPAEFISGKKWGATENQDIYDKSEYIDQQIPLASYANNMTGRSLSSGFTQPTQKAERDQRGDSPITDSLINLLTGMGAKEYTSEQYQSRALKDQKKRDEEELKKLLKE